MRGLLTICYLVLLSSISLSQTSTTWEVRMLQKINQAHYSQSAFWRPYSNSVMFVGSSNVLITPVLSNQRGENWKQELCVQAGGLLLNGASTWIVKTTAQRTRPFDLYPDLIDSPYHPEDYSFPSGHTSWAFQWATATSLYAKKWYVTVPCYAYAASIGFSRLVMGVHYPSDVLAGALLGSGSAWLSMKLNRKLFERKSKPRAS
jgi:membrane-associated phospholipid phosphatase